MLSSISKEIRKWMDVWKKTLKETNVSIVRMVTNQFNKGFVKIREGCERGIKDCKTYKENNCL